MSFTMELRNGVRTYRERYKKKFLRIINGEEYENFLCEEGVYKYIPKRLLYTFQKNIKPRIICRYLSKCSQEEVGLAVGIFLNQNNISNDEYKSKLIETINDIKVQEGYEEIEFLLDDNKDFCYLP